MPRREQDPEDDGYGEASRYTAHLDRGWSLLDRGDVQRARNSARQALELRPDVPDAAMLLAAIALAESDPETSLEWYERAIETDAEYVDAQLAAAQVLLYDLEQPERALGRAGQGRELEEASLADLLDFGLIEAEALVSLGDYEGAAERLEQLAELWVIEDLLDAETDREQLPNLLRQLSGDLEAWDADLAGRAWAEGGSVSAHVGADAGDFEPEELEHLMGRVVSLAVRVARLHIELGAPELALPWLDGLLRRFGDDPDIWYLTNEAAYLAGQPVRAAHAALQVLQLDARAPLSEPSPQPAEIHAKVVELLLACPDPDLRALARSPSFVVVVNEAPPFELVLEGVDPRARVLALAARTGAEGEAASTLTGLAVYRRNLAGSARASAARAARSARAAETGRVPEGASALELELGIAVLDELSVFFGFDPARRERLGLPASEGPPPLRAPEVAHEVAEAPVRKSKKAKPGSKTKRKAKPAKVDKAAKPKPEDGKPSASTRKPSDDAED